MKTSVATTIGIAVAALVFQFIPGLAEPLQWSRQNPFSLGIITGHLTHWSWDHFFWDMAAFLILAITIIRLIPERLGICLGLAALAIPLEVALFHPQFETYRGLSGIDSALFGLVTATLWNRGSLPRIFAFFAASLFLGKTGFEILTAQTLFVSNQGNTDFIPVPSAHLTGAVCGLVAGMRRLTFKGMFAHSGMLKSITHLAIFTALGIGNVLASEPVITKEVREENGKKVEYMFIDGIKVHETDPEKQPQPPVVTPKPYDAEAAKAPEDAIVLFDGTKETVTNWTAKNGKPTKWKLVDGALESVRGGGYIQSTQTLGSCQLHIEFATPSEPKGSGQGRGNSGVFLMGQYEIQVLDCFENQTYPDGQCGALYGRAKPLVNACRPPGEWQTYDITFHRPLFDDDGNVTRKAKFHVIHNGELIHDNVELSGGTGWRGSHSISEYKKHGDKGPVQMQDHGNPVRFRNIWVRELED